MVNIAIIEDSQTDREIISNFIQRYALEKFFAIEIHEFDNGASFMESAKIINYSIAFFDIYTNGENNVENARLTKENNENILIAFFTNSRDYAIEAFRIRASDYLLKPITYERFEETMNICYDRTVNSARFIEVKEGRVQVKILIRDIVYVDYFNHYVHIHAKNRIVRTYQYFNDFAPILNEYKCFLCCYRNCMINMDYVAELVSNDFVMKTGERVPISKAYLVEAKQKYAEYIFSKLEKEE